MNSTSKDTSSHDTMTSSSPSCLGGSAKGINTNETETSGKSSTKLPPLTKLKSE